MKVGGLDRLTIDHVVSIPDARQGRDPGETEPSAEVSYVPSKDALDSEAELLEDSRTVGWFAGGTVSNALYTMGLLQRGLSDPLALHWFGTVGIIAPGLPVAPLDSLRRVGIRPFVSRHAASHATALCVVAADSGRTRRIVVHRGDPIHAEPCWPPVEVLVVGMDGYIHAHQSVPPWVNEGGAIALLVDTQELPPEGIGWLERLASSGRLQWIIGRSADLAPLGLGLDEPPPSSLAACEVLATRGPLDVRAWDPERGALRTLPVLPIATGPAGSQRPAAGRGDDLGAGDAYAGAYLTWRLRGHPIESAHREAAPWAARHLSVPGPRLPPPIDMNGMFGDLIDRASARSDEALLFDRVRQTHGLTVISGGQTGVDQLALGAATRLGLACFAVMPEGRRIETSPADDSGSDHDLAGAFVTELASPRFRYRTWANAYLGDGTLIWDFHQAEGSAATRQACRTLGRPFLDVADVETADLPAVVCTWAARHDIRVVNVAGNRRSLMSPAQAEHAGIQIAIALRCLARAWARANTRAAEELASPTAEPKPWSVPTPDHPLRLGVPNVLECRAVIDQFLLERLGVEAPAPPRLFARPDGSGLELTYGRPRDLPAMLAQRGLDAVLCGWDVLIDAGVNAPVVLDTGLFCQLLVLVGRAGLSLEDPAAPTPRMISQYGLLAHDLLASSRAARREAVPVLGGAEAWISMGLADVALDTWRTGRTAEANGLRLLEVLGATSLVLAVTSESDRLAEAVWLGRELDVWLTSAG